MHLGELDQDDRVVADELDEHGEQRDDNADRVGVLPCCVFVFVKLRYIYTIREILRRL